ncbi:MAG: alpha/beta hydrolase [Planctomycetes bacterium]|nr:alpha/beta hydrolase [Planctomycetota bacterium]
MPGMVTNGTENRSRAGGEAVVLIHGLWMNGLDQLVLARRLRARGYSCIRFRYRSVRRTPAANAEALEAFVKSHRLTHAHFVAHSLGGIVLLHLFARWPDAPPGRSVLLSTPLRGSGAARRMARTRWLRWTLGRSTERGLLGDGPAVPARREVGMIAGTRGCGMGRIIGGVAQPSDGTVAAAETRAEGLTDWIQYPTSHFGLEFSAGAAGLIVRFLETGRFADRKRE